MAASSTSPTPSNVSDHHSVRPVACQRCRNRRSYCSKEKPKCSRCRDGAFDCVYEEGRKITVNEAYLRKLERHWRAQQYEYKLQRGQAGALSVPARNNSSDEYDEDFEEDEHPLLKPITTLNLNIPGASSTKFQGPGNSDVFLRSVRELSGLEADDESLSLQINDPGALPSRRELIRSHARLPPMPMARRLFAAQYTYIGTIFAFNDPAAFEELLREAYRGPPDLSDREACLVHAKVLVTLAFGQLYSVNQWIDFKGPPGFEYFQHALQLLPDPHEEGSILCIETLALVGYFLQNTNRREAAFLYIGMALRMAISLGLHQEVNLAPATPQASAAGLSEALPMSPPEMDELTRERRRRVWWSIYSLDRILSLKTGNPTAIQDEDIGVQPPQRLSHEPEYCPAVVLRHYTALSRILGEVTRAIYGRGRPGGEKKSGRRLIAAVQAIVVSLSKWHAELPPELRFDPARLSISRESVSTLLHYYQCINMTARPLLFHVVQKRLAKMAAEGPAEKERDWREGLSQTTAKVIEMCVSGAQDTISMMTIAAQRDLVATYGYMDGEHAFSAAIVLVMACVAFPTSRQNTNAMNAGLELLRGIAERGNSHLGTRYELLANLRSMIIPGQAGEEVAARIRSGSFMSAPMPPTPLTSALSQSPGAESLLAAQIGDAARQSFSSATSGPAETAGTFQGSKTPAFPTGAPSFPLVDPSTLAEVIHDEYIDTGTDFVLWEEGFANPAIDAGFDLSQWTAEMGGDAGMSM